MADEIRPLAGEPPGRLTQPDEHSMPKPAAGQQPDQIENAGGDEPFGANHEGRRGELIPSIGERPTNSPCEEEYDRQLQSGDKPLFPPPPLNRSRFIHRVSSPFSRRAE